ncbi:MAG: serine/threonine protein kinase [Desulfurococcaceae archaeon]
MHFLRNPSTYINRVLCYPSRACRGFEERLKMLLNDGFIYLLETGKNVFGIRILGRGYSAVTVVAYHAKYGIGALKVLRTDSRRNSLVHEAEMLKNAQPSGLPPNLYLYRDFYVFYELLPPHTCKSYTRVLEELIFSGGLESLVNLLRSTFTLLYALDSLRIDHTEINRPHGHVLYCDGKVKVLDWESAKITERPTNLTSFTSYLLYRFKYAQGLEKLLGYSRDRVLKALREYKTTYSREAFNELLHSLLPER